MIEYDKFQKSLKHLETQYQHYTTMDETLPEWLKEAVPESVIQRFETCFDCTWKTLKRYLKEEAGIAQTPNGPKPLFRMANENNLLEAGQNRGSITSMPETALLMITVVKKPSLPWRSCLISLKMPLRFTKN